jgi:hypothetical protein
VNPHTACSKCPHTATGCAGACPCKLDGKDIEAHKAAMYCPLGRFGSAVKPEGWDATPESKLRGLGDVVAAITSAVGIPPCGGCEERRDALNRIVPFSRPSGTRPT